MKTVILTFTGKTPLLMHDIRLSDPDDEMVRQIKAITDKRTKTEQDRREIERLEWFGGLVLDHNRMPAVKSGSIRKCLINSGKISKQGTHVARALSFDSLFVPLQYDGPREVEELWENVAFRNRSSVGIGQARTMRMRPQFTTWRVEASGFLMEDVIDFDTFTRIAERAGQAEGLGDNRANGYGRFVAEVKNGS